MAWSFATSSVRDTAFCSTASGSAAESHHSIPDARAATPMGMWAAMIMSWFAACPASSSRCSQAQRVASRYPCPWMSFEPSVSDCVSSRTITLSGTPGTGRKL